MPTGRKIFAFFSTFINSKFDVILILIRLGSVLGLLVGLFYGGLACIKHFVLRFILYRQGHIPWNYAHFLDWAVERILLEKAGSGYIFIHPQLQEYFAGLNSSQIKK